MDNLFDPFEIPKEVYTPILPLIGMMGLDTKKKKPHVMVWEAFTSNRRSDRIPLKFILYEDKIEMLPMKQKRQSYEWYIPKGILKSNWVNKYLNSIPSLLVLFWDLDWNDPSWLEEKNNIASAIQSIKLSIGGRSTRIAVVLLQSTSNPVPMPGEDGSGASEKAAALCAACDLPPKHLFVLPHTDSHLLGYAMRLENALSEIAGGFYLGEIKGIKAHRDYLNKTNHQLLFIRHQFKIAFHNEMRGDPQAATKHYGQCYHHLIEHRFTNTNLHEIRTVAAIVNYKICKLNFILNLPRDAIEQFKRHIEVFRQRTGPQQLIFEHYAWLSKQYKIFGEIFEEAVREGLPAVQTQHPGFYFQQAAHYAVLRRNTALQVCMDSLKEDTSPPETDLLLGWADLEFYGQRPWRPGKHSLEPPEMNTETEGIKALCHFEMKKVDHSALIIPQFSSAITQFKKYRCPRMKRYLMVQMAREYHEAHDSSKALTLLNHVMWDYRSERWWSLLSSCSFLALSCAYQVASLQEYLALCLEVLGPRVIATEEQKTAAYENLIQIINHEVPAAPPNLNDDVVSSSRDSWLFNLQTKRPNVVVSMNDIMPCIEVRAGFDAPQCSVDAPVKATVMIRNHLKKKLEIFFLIVHTESASCSQMKESDPSNLIVQPEAVAEVSLLFQPIIQDVGKTIKITDVTIGLGTCPEKTITLHWSGCGRDGVTLHTSPAPLYKEFGGLRSNPFELAALHSSINITSRSPKLEADITFDESSLVWEWLPINIEISNKEVTTISDLSLSLCLGQGSEGNLERTTQVSTAANLESKLSSSSVCDEPLPNLNSSETYKHLFYVKTLTAAKRTFDLKISYKCEVEMDKRSVVCPSILSKSFTITSKIPFQITIETQSLQFSPLSKVAKNERFLVVPRIKCHSHVPIQFSNSLISTANYINTKGENESLVSGVELNEGEEATDCFCISVGGDAPFGNPFSIGQYLLYWKRANGSSPPVSVSIGLPSIALEAWGIWLDVDLPPQGTVRVPLTVAYQITNTSDCVQEISVSMHVSDAFMFSGLKEVRLRVLPGWHECLTYTLYPLLAGYVQLPRLHVAMESPSSPTPASPTLDDFIQRILPSHLFIMPQEKGKEGISEKDFQNLLLVS